MVRLAFGALAVVWLSACELAEVAAPASADVLVAEAILRVGAEQQYVLLHRSLDGVHVRGEEGASVVVTGPDGEEIRYDEVSQAGCVVGNLHEGQAVISASCYLSPPEAEGFVKPGAGYELRVETVHGEVLRGRTVVPGDIEFRTPDLQVDTRRRIGECILPREPFTLAWTRAEGAWSYIVSLELRDWGEELRMQGIAAPDPLELTGVSVSAADTTLLFPANLGLFQRGDLDQRLLAVFQQGLPRAGSATLTILAADRNFTNGVRGGRFNPSGPVRLSSVVGDGVGVFGSVVPLTIDSRTDEEPSAPPCNVGG